MPQIVKNVLHLLRKLILQLLAVLFFEVFLSFVTRNLFCPKRSDIMPQSIYYRTWIHSSDAIWNIHILCLAEHICSDSQVNKIFISGGEEEKAEGRHTAAIKCASHERLHSHQHKCCQKQNKFCIEISRRRNVLIYLSENSAWQQSAANFCSSPDFDFQWDNF